MNQDRSEKQVRSKGTYALVDVDVQNGVVLLHLTLLLFLKAGEACSRGILPYG